MVKALRIVVTAAKHKLCTEQRAVHILHYSTRHIAIIIAKVAASLTVVFAERVEYATSTYKTFREITKDMNMNTMPSRS